MDDKNISMNTEDKDVVYSKKRFFLKKLIIVFLVFIILFLVYIFYGRYISYNNVADEYMNLARTEKDWIIEQQIDSGLILYDEWGKNIEQQVVPYFSTIAALGLLAGTTTDKDLTATKDYMDWYIANLNTEAEDPSNGDGTMFDYNIFKDGNVEVSVGTYDSVDAYAGIFLLLVNEYCINIGNYDYAIDNLDNILRVYSAMDRTILSDVNLSIVKNEHPFFYLMDNSEVYAGLLAMEDILKSLPNDTMTDYGSIKELAQHTEKQSADMSDAIENYLWNEDFEMYHYYMHEDGTLSEEPSFEVFYPDSTSQLFPIIFGLLDSDDQRSKDIYENFCNYWDWNYMQYMVDDDSSFYWGLCAYTGAIMNDEFRMATYMGAYTFASRKSDRAFPMYTGDAGWVAQACGYMEETYRNSWYRINLAH